MARGLTLRLMRARRWSRCGKRLLAVHRYASVDAAICARPSRITCSVSGRTSRATSRPLLKKISVGQSFTPNVRPSRRPGSSSILMCCTRGYSCNAAANAGCAAWQFLFFGVLFLFLVGLLWVSFFVFVGVLVAFVVVLV